MDKDFAQLIMRNLEDIKAQNREITEKINNLQIESPAVYATKCEVSNNEKSNKEDHKNLYQWILGVYSLILAAVVFMTNSNK